ncbi:bacteriocin [Lactococcus lactis]|uniref:bacteriocin n=1 Tax=Lactococcus lactis TaxID=1358 RepID=UPI0024189E73|nr:bacteriocin [Lactococcus lactis]MDG4966818.1 bacteriocin [Lactococcus lactis]
MKKDDIITLASGQTATILRGSESNYKNVYIVQLEDGQKRVVDRKTLELAESMGDTKSKHSYYLNK